MLYRFLRRGDISETSAAAWKPTPRLISKYYARYGSNPNLDALTASSVRE